MILLDTTVLVYAVGVDHPIREPCRAIVSAVERGRVEATTTVEVIQEFAHVRARRRGRADATSIGQGFAILLAPLVRPNDADVRRGLELFREHDQIGAFDAILTATVLNDDRLTGVVSADRAFAKIPGLRHEFPADVSIP